MQHKSSVQLIKKQIVTKEAFHFAQNEKATRQLGGLLFKGE
jgi:hypothetical protein